uniref:Uncharacterized protein n=1 Tax=Arundo donax TaxID=35708 RepID=A0A0A8XRT8_ARUDO
MMVGNLYWRKYIPFVKSMVFLSYMEEEYVDRHKPRKKTNRTNYQHYRWDCLNLVLDLLLIEFNDRFGETNSSLLTYMAALSPKDSFGDFKLESLMELAKLYPDDFSSVQLKDLAHELPIYIDNVQADERWWIQRSIKLFLWSTG